MTTNLTPPEFSKHLRFLDKRIDLPILYKKKDERYQFWETYIQLYNQNNNVIKIKKEYLEKRLPKEYYTIVFSRYGLVDGKDQLTEVEIKQGKNIGRSNETNVLSQGILEMTSKWNKRIDKDQYSTKSPKGEEIGINLSKKKEISDIRPMLLQIS